MGGRVAVIPTFKQTCKHILLITEQLTLDARTETINLLWQPSFPGAAIFWCLGHLAVDPFLCVRAWAGLGSASPFAPICHNAKALCSNIDNGGSLQVERLLVPTVSEVEEMQEGGPTMQKVAGEGWKQQCWTSILHPPEIWYQVI